MMKPLSIILLATTLGLATPSRAIVGGGAANPDTLARFVVTIIGSHGTVCSGALIAPNIVLTAGHCIAPGTSYRVLDYTTQPPRLLTAQKVMAHPQFSLKTMLAHRATADVALLLLPSPCRRRYLPCSARRAARSCRAHASRSPVSASRFRVAMTASAPFARAAGRHRPAQRFSIRLVDPATNNIRGGLGACTGDSGAPAFEDQDGRAVIVGVVSWSTGANNSDGCGGLTGVTPLTIYRDWILQTARGWGAAM